MRFLAWPALAIPAAAAALPGWWQALPNQTALAARFVQESDSAVFGKLRQKGSLVLARGGRLRVAYDSGLLVLSDGDRLVQYDPDTRTAQGAGLQEALKEYPLLSLLLDLRHLRGLYRAEAQPGGAVRLLPLRPGLPEVVAEGQGRFLKAVSWTDPTGARQRLVLLDPRVPPAAAPGTFRFDPPPGTRWATPSR